MGRRNTIFFVVLPLAVVVLFVGDLLLGSVAIPFDQVWTALFGRGGERSVQSIVLSFRLPKAITAIIVGSCLSSVGLQMQTLFRNPLAGPYVLGVSSGASLGAALFLLGMPILGLSETGVAVRSIGVVGSAWIGAASIMMIVMAVSSRIKDIMVILIMGMMFSSAVSAVVEIMQYFSPEGQLKSFVIWTMGSLGSVSTWQLNILVPVAVVGLTASIALIKPLNMLLLGESYARTMGMNVRAVRAVIFAVTILLAGAVTAFCGPIGFIGLAVPHLSRMILRSADHRVLMPASMLLGAAVMLLCDIVSQLPSSDMNLPINTVTALLGIPIVILVVARNRKHI